MSDFNSANNRVVWFDIPVRDLDRAAAFYRAVLDVQVQRQEMGDFAFCVFEHRDGNGGCLVKNEAEIGPGGVMIYLNANGRIRDAVAKVGPHGGRVVEDVKSIGPHGFRAVLIDSEGNRVALHSRSDG